MPWTEPTPIPGAELPTEYLLQLYGYPGGEPTPAPTPTPYDPYAGPSDVLMGGPPTPTPGPFTPPPGPMGMYDPSFPYGGAGPGAGPQVILNQPQAPAAIPPPYQFPGYVDPNLYPPGQAPVAPMPEPEAPPQLAGGGGVPGPGGGAGPGAAPPPPAMEGPGPWGGWGEPAGYFGVPESPNIGEFGAPTSVAFGGGVPGSFGTGVVAPGASGMPLPGSFAGLGAGSGGTLGGLGGILGMQYLQRLMKGIYTSPYLYGEMKGLGGAYGHPGMHFAPGARGGLAPFQSYKDYHANELYWGNVFRQRGYILPPQQRGRGGASQGAYGTSTGSSAAQAGMQKTSV